MDGMVGSPVPLENLLSQAEMIGSVPTEEAEACDKEVACLLEVQEAAR